MGKRILAIDDEEELLEVLDSILTSHGYEVITAQGGAEGVKAAQEQDPDLILLDIAMPKMDGLEVLSKLRGSTVTSRIPVVMLTAKGSTENIFQSEKFRATEFLIKPIPSDELINIIRRHIR